MKKNMHWCTNHVLQNAFQNALQNAFQKCILEMHFRNAFQKYISEVHFIQCIWNTLKCILRKNFNMHFWNAFKMHFSSYQMHLIRIAFQKSISEMLLKCISEMHLKWISEMHRMKWISDLHFMKCVWNAFHEVHLKYTEIYFWNVHHFLKCF